MKNLSGKCNEIWYVHCKRKSICITFNYPYVLATPMRSEECCGHCENSNKSISERKKHKARVSTELLNLGEGA